MPTYDTVNKIVIADQAPTSDAVNTDVLRDLYSDAKVQWLNDLALNKFKFPWTTVGGNPLPDGGVVPRFFFLRPPWVLRPYEADHAWNLSGNIFRLDGAKLTTATLGDFTVEINVITDVGPQDLLGAIAVGNKSFANILVEMYQRFDLLEGSSNRHWKDSSRIAIGYDENSDTADIDLRSTDNGDGTFDVERQ